MSQENVELVYRAIETFNRRDLRGGKVRRMVLYGNRDRALADLGLEE